MKACVILPTYNEALTIETVVKRIVENAPEVDMLIVDDNSPDGTADRVRELQATLPQLGLLVRTANKGFANSYIDGFRLALARPDLTHLVTMDADLSHDPSHLKPMMELARRYDVVIGSRYVEGGHIPDWELWRKLLSDFGNRYCRFITRMPIRDCTTGYQVISLECVRRFPLKELRMSGYAFLMELKYLLWKYNATFTESPITFSERTEGESKMTANIIAEGLLAPWKLRFRRLPVRDSTRAASAG